MTRHRTVQAAASTIAGLSALLVSAEAMACGNIMRDPFWVVWSDRTLDVALGGLAVAVVVAIGRRLRRQDARLQEASVWIWRLVGVLWLVTVLAHITLVATTKTGFGVAYPSQPPRTGIRY